MAKPDKKVANNAPVSRKKPTQPNKRELSRTEGRARRAVSPAAASSSLTEQQKRFADEYLIDLCAAAAYKRAGYRATGRSAIAAASRLLSNVDLQKYLHEQFAVREARVEIKQDDVLRELQAILKVDPNEIVSFRRECCRHCWGKDHAYQFKTKRELEAARRSHASALRAAQKAELPQEDWPVFDASGGLGFEPSREPNNKCPECDGNGFGRVFISDTRRLSHGAKSLYGGVKHTKEGIEVRLHSKEKAIELAMRHLGMLKDRLDINVSDSLAERLAAARERRAAAHQRPNNQSDSEE
ncbi:terminase small subunit [Paraburkholderia nemoris]|uniref:terminase small subunit n=1 Tax=Paraburkholderia nemoris TaxID=2793076 RepID=UPI0038BB82E6